MALNINIDNITLDILSTRLKNQVSQLDILKWLGNFEKHETELAIDIIKNLTIYTSFEIEEILNQTFNSFIKKIEKNEILIIHPIGKFGKSGTMITYFFQKTNFYKLHKNKIILLPVIENIEIKQGITYNLILIDDFVGTGQSVEDFFVEKINPITENFNSIFFVGIAGMKDGIRKINKYFSRVLIPNSNIFEKVFSSESSYFGYRKHINYRLLAYKYGSVLTSPIKLKNGNDKFIHALGYNNAQALVSFSYGSPNNTLPIIWSNKDNWIPLLPRFSKDKISQAREFRKNISFELSILKEFGSDLLKDNFFSLEVKRGKRIFSSVNHIDFSIYGIIKLKR